jgi:hypothetical protein
MNNLEFDRQTGSNYCVYETALNVANDFGVSLTDADLHLFSGLKKSSEGINLFRCAAVFDRILNPHEIAVSGILVRPGYLKKLLDIRKPDIGYHLISLPGLVFDRRIKFTDNWVFPFAAVMPGMTALHVRYFSASDDADFLKLQYDVSYDLNQIPLAYKFSRISRSRLNSR